MSYIWQQKTWPKMSWKSEPLLPLISKARLAQGKLLSKVTGLGFQLGQEARAEIIIEEAVKTAAIEGECLNRESVKSSVARRLGLPTAGLPSPSCAVDGLVQVLIDATQNFDKPLTAERLKGWQAALFPDGYSDLVRIRVGKWRGLEEPMRVVSGPVGREKIHYEAPPGEVVEREMRQFLSWWKTSLGREEGFLRAGIAHLYFVTIHPFEDGNGRIARALTDMALAQDEKISTRFYSLSSQIMAERGRYYEILEKSQKSTGDVTPWLEWFLGCYVRAIERTDKLIADIMAKAEFWMRHHTTSLTEHQRKVVNRLLDAGQGGFEGGLTTRIYVSITQVSRATAFREISDLVQKGILHENSAKGRSASYDLRWDEGQTR